MEELTVGVVGYYPPTLFDEAKARCMIEDAYEEVAEQFGNRKIVIVSRLINEGICKIAYDEAVMHGWRTVGIACGRDREHEHYPVDEKLIIGKSRGDESPTFVATVQAIVRIGVEEQSLKETELVKSYGLPAFEYDLPVLILDRCRACKGSGVYYHGSVDTKGVGIVCGKCFGSGALRIEYIPFLERRQREGIDIVNFPQGSFIGKGYAQTDCSMPYEEFLTCKIPAISQH